MFLELNDLKTLRDRWFCLHKHLQWVKYSCSVGLVMSVVMQWRCSLLFLYCVRILNRNYGINYMDQCITK